MKRIAIIAIKGGVGKTTLANELAYSLDRTDIPYSYLDMDGQRGGTHKEVERDDAELMLLDTPAAMETDDLVQLAESADIVVIPTRTGTYEMYSFSETLKTLREANSDIQVIIVHNAANRYRLAREYRNWLEEHGNGALVLSVPQAEVIPQAQALGKSVVTYAPRSKAAGALKNVVNAVREAAELPKEE